MSAEAVKSALPSVEGVPSARQEASEPAVFANLPKPCFFVDVSHLFLTSTRFNHPTYRRQKPCRNRHRSVCDNPLFGFSARNNKCQRQHRRHRRKSRNRDCVYHVIPPSQSFSPSTSLNSLSANASSMLRKFLELSAISHLQTAV